jgi:hypothetical protein
MTQVLSGAITYNERDLDWSFVILGRDDGKFRALDRDVGFDALQDARRLLVEKMALVVAMFRPRVSLRLPAA